MIHSHCTSRQNLGRLTLASVAALALLTAPVLAQTLDGGKAGGFGTEARPALHPIGQVDLTEVTAEIGMSSTYTTGNSHTGGGAWVDYNSDYWPDLFITNGSGYDHYLYRNNGDGTFTDVSSIILKPDIDAEDAGVIFGDIDNDGDEDILVYSDYFEVFMGEENVPDGGPNMLYVNQGHDVFTEMAAASGIMDPRGWRNISAGFADYDRDGYLDVYLGHWQRNNPVEEGTTDYDRLLNNDGDGTFTDVSAPTRVNGYGRDVLTSIWFDLNQDGWQDLYVGNTGFEGEADESDSNDILYINDPDVPWFWDGTGDSRVVGDDAKAAMGIDVCDYDMDGFWDMYITDMPGMGAPPLGNVLYLGLPNGWLSDNVSDIAGVPAQASWPCNFADFDLDGWADLWVGTDDKNKVDYMYMNNRDRTFSIADVPEFLGNAAKGGTIADYDGDGDVDIFMWRMSQDSLVFRNDTQTDGHWAEFKLFGDQSNRSAIGAVLRVTAYGKTQMRRVSGGDSAHSQMDLIPHFGFRPGTTTVDVAIDWPSGAQTTHDDLPVDQLHFIDETAGVLSETLPVGIATWDSSSQTLTVRTVSSFGGRPDHSVQGFGELPYLVANKHFLAVYEGVAADPGSITVDSSFGGSFVISVDVVP